MSDWLVRLQDSIAGYPSWLVIGGAVIILALIFMLLGRVLKLVGVLMFVALALGGIWYAWQQLFADHDARAESSAVHEQVTPEN